MLGFNFQKDGPFPLFPSPNENEPQPTPGYKPRKKREALIRNPLEGRKKGAATREAGRKTSGATSRDDFKQD